MLTKVHNPVPAANASLLGKTLAHYTTAHFVVMLISSRDYSRHHYPLHYYMKQWLTHMRESKISQQAWKRKVDALAHLYPDLNHPAVQLTLSGHLTL